MTCLLLLYFWETLWVIYCGGETFYPDCFVFVVLSLRFLCVPANALLDCDWIIGFIFLIGQGYETNWLTWIINLLSYEFIILLVGFNFILSIQFNSIRS